MLAPWSGGERSEPERKGAKACSAKGCGLLVERSREGHTHNGLFPKLGSPAWFFLNGGVRVPAGSDRDAGADLHEAVAYRLAVIFPTGSQILQQLKQSVPLVGQLKPILWRRLCSFFRPPGPDVIGSSGLDP